MLAMLCEKVKVSKSIERRQHHLFSTSSLGSQHCFMLAALSIPNEFSLSPPRLAGGWRSEDFEALRHSPIRVGFTLSAAARYYSVQTPLQVLSSLLFFFFSSLILTQGGSLIEKTREDREER
jgi:hypothetical protein